jgi:hypothetical protein
MKKIILTGSAPHFPSWWNSNVSKLDNWLIYSINTSALITNEKCCRWFKSTDFEYYHPEIDPVLISSIEGNVHKFLNKQQYYFPFRYESNNTSGTMLFNALRDILNDAFWKNDTTEVGLIGCDLIYKPDKINHFYGNTGTDDPMRLGLECISQNLLMFKKAYSKIGISLFNLSPEIETLLPFDKKTL